MIKQDLAWAAGLLEGEGTFCVRKTGNSNALCISCEMSDIDVILRLYNIFGGYVNKRKKVRENRKPTWTWYITSRNEVLDVINTLYPHMSCRRKEQIQKMRKAYSTIIGKNVKSKFKLKNYTNNKVVEGTSIRAFCKTYNLGRESIRQVLNGKQKSHKGWIKS